MEQAAGGGTVLQGIVRRVTYQDPDSQYVVLRLEIDPARPPVTVVGHLVPVPAVAQPVRVVGEWTEHPVYGSQFRAIQYQPVTPSTAEGIERFLASGVVRGVGPATARRLVARFGERTLDVIAREPEELATIDGIGPKKAESIARQLAAHRGTQESLVFLHSLGVGPGLARRIVGRYRDRTIAVVRESPYLLALEVGGIGFRRADDVAARFGVAPDDAGRVRAAVWHVLQQAAEEGHLFLPRPELERHAAQLLQSGRGAGVQFSRDCLGQALEALAQRGDLVLDAERVYSAGLYRHETALAAGLRGLLAAGRRQGWLPEQVEQEIRATETATGRRLAPEQRQAVEAALEHPVLVVTGGPGTGKTTLVRFVVRLWAGRGARLALAAPTGRAAQRLKEAIFGAGEGPALVGVEEPRTVHRLLEPRPSQWGAGEGGGARFARGKERPLDADVIIVDEASMLDVAMARYLVEAIRPGVGRLILVGDVNQLPSVGPGQVLRDIIESGTVPVVELRHVFRQAATSGIVRGAHQLLEGRSPVALAGARRAGAGIGAGAEGDRVAADDARRAAAPPARAGALRFVEAPDAATCAERVQDLVATILPAQYGFDPFGEIQVLCATHRGPAGSDQLNTLLQQVLNPPGPGRPELAAGQRVFRLGDRVMQIRNEYQAQLAPHGPASPEALAASPPAGNGAEGEPVGVFNGEVGRVVGVDPERRTLEVQFDDGRRILYEAERLGQLQLAYATTVHKSQGNEFRCVVMPAVWVMPSLMTRHLLYTAVTRGKELVVLVGQRQAVAAFARNGTVSRRYSALAVRVREAHGGPKAAS